MQIAFGQYDRVRGFELLDASTFVRLAASVAGNDDIQRREQVLGVASRLNRVAGKLVPARVDVVGIKAVAADVFRAILNQVIAGLHPVEQIRYPCFVRFEVRLAIARLVDQRTEYIAPPCDACFRYARLNVVVQRDAIPDTGVVQ